MDQDGKSEGPIRGISDVTDTQPESGGDGDSSVNKDCPDQQLGTDQQLSTDQQLGTDQQQDPDKPTQDNPVEGGIGVDGFAKAFLDETLDGLDVGKSQLQELTSNQMVLIETVQHENSKFDECHAFKELSDTIARAKLYHTKLTNLRKEMVSLHDKSFKLKKRAVRIQQQKQKEELQRANQIERDFERERALMAKPAPVKSEKT